MINALSSAVARFISFISESAKNIFENLNILDYSAWQVVIDIVLVAILFYWLILLIRGSRAINIMFGLFILAIVFGISRFLNLLALGWILDRFLTVILVAIPIIFQQELRRGLEKLGRTKFFLAQEAKEIDLLRSQIISACFDMAQRKIGALIVFRGEVNLKEYIDTGILISAKISKELLMSLFHSGSPLHDGAVILDDNRLVAAGCILPHSFKEYGHTFGTRHKAALGLSEVTDASIFVVSEQRGEVSFVSHGHIEEHISPERAQEIITEIFSTRSRRSGTKQQARRVKP